MPLPDTFLARLVVPVVVTILAVLLVRLLAGRAATTNAVSVAVPIGLIAGYVVLPGLPWAPPTLAADKLVWLALGGALLGLMIDLGTRGRIASGLAALVWPAVGMAWLGGPALLNDRGSNLYRFFEVSLVLGLLLARLGQLSDDRLQGPVTAAVVATGLGCLGLASGEPTLAAIGFPLAAAVLGWLACNWPTRRFRFGAAGLLGGAGAGLVLAGNAALLTPVNATLVLLVLLAVPLQLAMPVIARRIPALDGPALRPIAMAAIAAVPSVVAVLLAWLAPTLLPSLY